MLENVRLIIWDLDDTFWSGSVAEGTFKYNYDNHDIVIELARRGIVSSICSKNDPLIIKSILSEHCIDQYFIFPDVSWDPKGPRIRRLIATIQMRAETTLFIDDNPSNRAEAASFVPGLQIADELVVPKILNNPRFMGSQDENLQRLRHYKNMEIFKTEREQFSGSNEEFLRQSGIKLSINTDISANLDRSIELINRTNQLNFTKNRLPEDIDKARQKLLDQISLQNCQAGLIRLVDNYGDYGFVGFFLVQEKKTANGIFGHYLEHFCFSCRTLGMLVEKWVYDHLEKPIIELKENMLINLHSNVNIDWIKLVDNVDNDIDKNTKQIDFALVFGGCEVDVLSFYISSFVNKVTTISHFAAGALFFRMNSAEMAHGLIARTSSDFERDAHAMGLPIDRLVNNFFDTNAREPLFIFNFHSDAFGREMIQNNETGLVLAVEAIHKPQVSLLRLSREDINKTLEENTFGFTETQKLQLINAWNHASGNYRLKEIAPLLERISKIDSLIEKIPSGSRVIFVVNHWEWLPSYPSPLTAILPNMIEFLDELRKIVQKYPFADVVSISEVLSDISEHLEGGHYSRLVFQRLAQTISERAVKMPQSP